MFRKSPQRCLLSSPLVWSILGAIVLSACAPARVGTEGGEDDGGTIDAGVDGGDAGDDGGLLEYIGNDCEWEEIWETPEGAERCVSEAGPVSRDDDRDKVLPLMVIITTGVGVYRAYRITAMVGAFTATLSNGRTVQITREALLAIAAGALTTQMLQQLVVDSGIPLSWEEALQIHMAAASTQRTSRQVQVAPRTVQRQCRQDENDQLYDYHRFCDQSWNHVSDARSCWDYRDLIEAQKECMERRRYHAQRCFPQGGLGPMRAGDYTHNIAWCNHARRAQNLLQQLYRTYNQRGGNGCGNGFLVPYVPPVPAECDGYI